MWKPTGLCEKLHAAGEEQVPLGPAHRLAINFSLTPELARCRSEYAAGEHVDDVAAPLALRNVVPKAATKAPR